MGKRIRITMLCLVALLSIGAASASGAAAAPHWTVGGKALTGAEALNETVTLEKGTSFEWVRPGLFRVTCPNVAIQSGSLKESSKLSGTLRLSGCVVKDPTGQTTVCEARKSPSSWGTIEAPITGELKTAGEVTYLSVPLSFQISFRGTTCALEGNYPFGGRMAFEVPTTAGAFSLSLTGSQALDTATESRMVWGNSYVYTEAKMGLSIASGQKWGVGL